MERMKGYNPVNPEIFAAIDAVCNNLYQIAPMACEHVGKAIFPIDLYGTLSEHFTSKLIGYSDNGLANPLAIMKWLSSMSEDNRQIVYNWMSAKQF